MHKLIIKHEIISSRRSLGIRRDLQLHSIKLLNNGVVIIGGAAVMITGGVVVTITGGAVVIDGATTTEVTKEVSAAEVVILVLQTNKTMTM